MIMEKSRSYPDYKCSYSGEFGFEDGSKAPYTFNGPSNKGEGGSELKRKKRIAAYNMFTTEGKLKSTVRESFKWIKNKFTGDVRYGM